MLTTAAVPHGGGTFGGVAAPDDGRYRKVFDTLAVAIWEHDMRPVKTATDVLRARGVSDLSRYFRDHPRFVGEVRHMVRITDVNQTAVRMMGIASKEQFFARLGDLLPEDDPSFEQCILAIDEGRPSFVSEARVRSATGELIPVLIALSFPPGEGLARISGSVLDLREQVKLQRTLERTRAELEHALRAASLGELGGSIAHEVNQPLSAVMSFAHAARRWLRRPAPDIVEALRALDDVLHAAEHASDVVGRVRKLMGKVEAEKSPVAIDPLAAETLDLVRRRVEAHGVTIEVDLDASETEVVGDRVLLQQLILNLINNAMQALEAMPENARRVILSTRREGGHVVIDVEDAGPGFSDEAVDHAFQSFFTTKPQGMGLGLSISRSTAEAHGGSLSIGASPTLGGARLRIMLPGIG